ncbi:hypothetical protein VAPA_2c05480 [Variovorax paradoxus B4]|uniref:Uncharacterized protein n=1 Tax=Variovorax paradoxus B4 TaxID=1246301 RepID=T1XKK8_VARPD|nr:hypothetical protein VAPA_2c05480 [Variovorax paradoxus B4]
MQMIHAGALRCSALAFSLQPSITYPFCASHVETGSAISGAKIDSQAAIVRNASEHLFARIQAGLEPSPDLFHAPFGGLDLGRKCRLQPLHAMLIRARLRTISRRCRRRKMAVGKLDPTALEFPFSYREHHGLRSFDGRIIS